MRSHPLAGDRIATTHLTQCPESCRFRDRMQKASFTRLTKSERPPLHPKKGIGCVKHPKDEIGRILGGRRAWAAGEAWLKQCFDPSLNTPTATEACCSRFRRQGWNGALATIEKIGCQESLSKEIKRKTTSASPLNTA